MRIVFIGVVEFSLHCLKEVVKCGGEVVGIVTIDTDRNNSDFVDLRPFAISKNIPVFVCHNINDPEPMTWMRLLAPDVIFCWGLSQMVRKELLLLPPLGVIGAHPALLPQNRGRHPLIWGLVLGLRESGLTFFRMDEGADSGPILSQQSFSIDTFDTAATLYEKIKKCAIGQIAEFLPSLVSGSAQFTAQDHSKANSWRKRKHVDGAIDWRMSADCIDRLVRALVRPYPGAEFIYTDTTYVLWKAHVCAGETADNHEPGKVIAFMNGFPVVKCGIGAIVLEVIEPRLTLSKGEYLQ